MKTKPIVFITFLFLLTLSLVLSSCQNPLASILQRAPTGIAPTETVAVITTDEPTADEAEQTEPTRAATETARPAATPTAASMSTEEPSQPPTPPPMEDMTYTPLPEEDCAHITDLLSTAFAVEFDMAEIDFQDLLTGETGRGCAAQAAGDGNDFDSPSVIALTVGQQLSIEGWATDVQYAADGPTGTVVGFRKENQLCILSANWTPSADADCASDQPISECDLTPAQKLFQVALICAQHSGQELVENATGSEVALSPSPTTPTLPEPTAQAPLTPVTSPEQAHRIEFPPGGTAVTVEDSVGPSEVDLYVLRAMQGQTLCAELYSPKGNAVIAIWGADGVVLLSDHAGAHNWTGLLPNNQDYYISVAAVAGTSTSYTLAVSVSALTAQPTVVPPPPTIIPTPLPVPAPMRIEFAPGTDAATVAGGVAAGGTAHYVIRANAHQTMSVNVVSATGDVRIAIRGADGTVLLPNETQATSWTGLLPLAQDYFIEVIAGAAPADFTLQVVIPPTGLPTTEPAVKRIAFATGSISATETGTVLPGGIMRYLVGAMMGQTLTVNLNVPQGAAALVIWGADGTVLLSDHAGATSWSGMLPASQDYIIDVKSLATSPTNFTLQVTIPPL